MRKATTIVAALVLATPIPVVAATSAGAAGGGAHLVASGSVTLRDLSGVAGAEEIGSPELPADGRNESGAQDGAPSPAPATSPNRVVAAGPELGVSFQGINHRDQRLAFGGNQFSLEPPDQALCVSDRFVVEAVNDAIRVFDKSGTALTSTIALNQFYGYAPAINRTTRVFGPEITDPVCHFDADTGRFFVLVLTLEQNAANGHLSGANHLDLAVSNSSDPTGSWTRYRMAVQNDGTQGTPNHACAPGKADPAKTNPNACIGDYPHIGADRNGIFMTTNEYSFFGPGYNGAQIYAISKRALAAATPSPTVVAFESPVLGPFKSFTVWPAISPAGKQSAAGNGTEFLLSSTLGDGSETGNHAATENRIGVWSITNTATLDSATPHLRLQNRLIKADTYALPPAATQKPGPTPLRDCINNLVPGCWQLFFANEPAHDEVLSHPDSLDTRMQQVTYADGLIWGAFGTAVQVTSEDGPSHTRAGVLWVAVRPDTRGGRLDGQTVRHGYLSLENNDLTMPSLGLTSSGNVLIGMTVMGDDHFPSAAYALLARGDDNDTTVKIAAEGVGPDDGFTGYKAFVGDPPRTRWGDYGATASDGDTVWVANEYIAQRCTLTQYLTGAIGSCGGTRTALANWSTRISAITPSDDNNNNNNNNNNSAG